MKCFLTPKKKHLSVIDSHAFERVRIKYLVTFFLPKNSSLKIMVQKNMWILICIIEFYVLNFG
jgi:hypothetical protein